MLGLGMVIGAWQSISAKCDPVVEWQLHAWILSGFYNVDPNAINS